MDRFDHKYRRHVSEITFGETDIPLYKQRRWSRENRSFIRTSAGCLKFCGWGNIKHFVWTKAREEHLNKNIHVLEHMSGSKQTSLYWPVMSLFNFTCTDKKFILDNKEVHTQSEGSLTTVNNATFANNFSRILRIRYDIYLMFFYKQNILGTSYPTSFSRRCSFSFWRNSTTPPTQWAKASSFTRFLDCTQRRTTVGRTPLGEWSTHRRDLYLTTHNTTDKHQFPPVGFEPTISAGQRPQTYASAARPLGPVMTLVNIIN